MARRVQVKLGNETVEGDELDFETVNETWNEYACIDGTTVRAKLVASKIVRIIGRTAPNGDPLYLLQSSNVVAINPPASVIKPS